MQPPSPSSSATTPSPSLPFLNAPGAVAAALPVLADLDPQECEERQRAVKKFLARAECSKLTRGLRARLAYASYKATHNLAHVPLPVLEHRIHPAHPSPPPPPSPPSPKRPPSLYASLLGPPPPKRPRHVYGPAPADLLPPPSTPSRSKSAAATPRSPFAQGRTVRTVLQGRARSTVTEKEDINAAATLTALMQRKDRAGDKDGGGRAPTPDADAAELMLYLATSPSPVRPPTQRRMNVGMGRVLFAGADADADAKDDRDVDMRPATPIQTQNQNQNQNQSNRATPTPTPTQRATPAPTFSQQREATPGLTASQSSSLPSSQDTSLLLPPPSHPFPCPPHHPPSPHHLHSPSPQAQKFDVGVGRRLFGDQDVEMGGAGAGFALGKGIEIVEAK